MCIHVVNINQSSFIKQGETRGSLDDSLCRLD